MAVTFTPKGLPQWQLGTDSPSRDLFNAAFALIDDGFMADIQGPLSSRPTAGIAGRFYTTTDSSAPGLMFRDNGSVWQAVNPVSSGGGTTFSYANIVATTAGGGGVPLSAQGTSGQSGNLFQALTAAGSVVASIDPTGDFATSGSVTAAGLTVTGATTLDSQLTVNGAVNVESGLTVTGTINAPAMTSASIQQPIGHTASTNYTWTDSASSFLGVSVTAPPSGKVEVRAYGFGESSANVQAQVAYQVLSGASVIQAFDGNRGVEFGGGPSAEYVTSAIIDIVTGLTPGTTYTFQLGFRSNTGDSVAWGRWNFSVVPLIG